MSIPGISITEATGVPPLPDAGIISRVAVIAPANAGTFDAKPIYGMADFTEFGKGVLVRHGKHIFAETKTPLVVVRCGATNSGEYDTIDNSAVTGTAIPTVVSSTVPTDESELYVKIVDGGTVCTTGITYRRSDANGREQDTNMPLRALGTGSRILFDDVNAAIDLEPPAAQVAALVTRTNDLRTKVLAHMAYTTGTVHTNADTTSDDGIASACTNVATSISLMSTISAGLALHFARGSGDTIHINVAGDNTTSLAAANTAIATAVASGSGQDAIKALAALTAAYALHLANTTAHTIADATNVLTAPVPTTGTLIAGDIIRCATIAPTPNDTDITAAFDKLKVSPSKPGMVLFPGRTDAALATTIGEGLDTLEGRGIFVPAMVQARAADSETLAEHVDNVETEWLAEGFDKRIDVVAGDYLCTFNDGARLRQRLTGYATHMMVRTILTEYFRTTWQRVQLDNVTHLNSLGVPIGWDESNTPDKPRRVQVGYEVPGTSTFVPSFDMTLYDPDNDRTQTFREERVIGELKRIVNTWGSAQIGLLGAVTPIANTQTGTLNNSSRLSLQQSLAAIIAANMGGTLPNVAIIDTDKPDLVVIDPIVDILGAIFGLRLTVNFTIIAGLGRISSTLAVRTGS